MTNQTNTQVNTQSIQGINAMNTMNNTDIDFNLDTNEETNMVDYTLDFSLFSSSTNTLPTAITSALDASREAILDKNMITAAKRADSALSIIMAHHMIKQVGKDSFIGSIIFDATIEGTYWWKNSPREDKKTTHGKRIQDALIRVVGNDSPSVGLFIEAVKYFKGYIVEKREKEGKYLVQVDKDGNKTDIKQLDLSALKVTITPYGLRVAVGYGNTIRPIKGQDFIFHRNVQQTFGINIINEHLETVMKSIRIHNEYTKFIDKQISDKKIMEYTKEAYKFRKEDALVILLLLKENNIDIKDLFENAVKGNEKLLILSRKEGMEGVKSLHRIVVPAHNFKEKYGKTGVVSTNDAKQGFVVPMVTIPRLVEFTTHNGEDVVITRENVNKTASRFDKLNNADALWTRTLKLFVVADATKHSRLNDATVGGNILVPNHIMLSDGACRVVSDMDNGGIKASYTPFQKLDPTMANGDICVISSAGFKGGMLSALGMAYGNIDIVKNLFNIIDINTIQGSENFDMDVIAESEQETDHIINQMKQAVINRMVDIEIAGEMVTGVMVTVDVKITNAYSVDMMQAVTEDEKFSGKKAMNDTKENIENVLEEMDTNSKSSKGLRAYVSEQKKASADLFSVCDWIKSGLSNGTLKKKALTTKVISQEIQTIAMTEGKDVAIKFLEELLELQAEAGFSINKMYAYQLLGAIEKDIINTIDIKSIVHILINSPKGLVEGSPVYSKSVMQDILDIIGTESYGWTTVEYPNGTLDVPMGSILLGDILDQMDNDKGFVIAKGLIADLLENCKTLVKSNGEYYEDSNNHLVMEAFIQKPLLGKNFGYQFVKGYYGVALPMLGNYGVSTAGITNRNRMMKSDKTWEVMTLSKAPQYFKGMTASYNIIDLDFGSDMNLVLECAVFVNPEIVLMHQNDFDGDMYRISLGSSLPFVERIYNEFNGQFFKDFYQGEMEGNKFKMKKAQQCTLEGYHEAIHKAVLAKDHIGSYTANSYFYEAMLSNLIDTSFMNTIGDVVNITEEKAYELTAILKMLIQVEAMDNVKQEGSDTYITEMLMHYKLRNLKGYAGMSDDEVIQDHLYATKKALLSLVKSSGIKLDKEEVSDLVEIAYYTSIKFNTESTAVFNMFNARNIEEKNFNNILKFVSTGEELDTKFNFNNAFETLRDGFDTESMYYSILIKTAQAIEDSNGNIRI